MRIKNILLVIAALQCGGAFAQNSILTGSALQDYFVGHTVIFSRDRDNATVQIDAKPDGTAYTHTPQTGGKIWSNSGTWQIKYQGTKFCLDFNYYKQASNVCYGVLHDTSGDVIYVGPANKPQPFGKVIH